MFQPTPPIHADASHLEGWHRLHREALQRMDTLETALAGGVWAVVDEACRWIYEELRPHNEAEERELFPLLEELGAEQLQEQLLSEHREMWDLNLQILTGIAEGTAKEPGVTADLARRMLALVRQLIDTEEHLLLPLLRGRCMWPSDEVTE